MLRRMLGFRRHALDFFAEHGRFEDGLIPIDFGVQMAYVVCEPQLAVDLLTHPAVIKGERPYGPLGTFAGFGSLRGLIGPSLPVLDGPPGATRRQAIHPIYHRITRRLADVQRRAPPVVWPDPPAAASDLYPLASAVVFGRFCEVMFGRRYPEQAAPIAEAVSVATTALDILSKSFVPYAGRLSAAGARLRRSRRTLLDFAEVVYADLAERSDQPHPPAFAALIDAGLPRATVIDEIVTQIVAGTETSTTTVCWAMTELARHPDALGAIREAPDRSAAIGRCVRETTRLYPAFWSMIRVAEQPIELGGRRFARGDLFFVAPYCIHRNPHFWPDPDRFDPARFVGRAAVKGDFMPYGYGARACIGGRLAQGIIAECLSAAVDQLDWRLSDPAPVIDPLIVVLKSRTGFPMHVTPRKPASHSGCADAV